MIHGRRKAVNGKNEFAGRPVNVMDRRELLNSLRDDDDDELDNAANEGGDADLNGNQSRFVYVLYVVLLICLQVFTMIIWKMEIASIADFS